MQHLVGNIWIHDPGTGEVSIYERIGRNYRPLRAESEPLPDRIPFEAQQTIRLRLKDAAVALNNRTPKEVRLANLDKALALFPAYTNLDSVAQERFKERLAEGLPETWEEKPPETEGIKRPPTVEEQVEAANKLRSQQVDAQSQLETALLRERTEKEVLLARLASLEAKVNGEKKEESKGQDAGGPSGLLGQEARQEAKPQDDSPGGEPEAAPRTP